MGSRRVALSVVFYNYDSLLKLVAPAKAGAYLACRFKRRDVMGPSLRWGDGAEIENGYSDISPSAVFGRMAPVTQ